MGEAKWDTDNLMADMKDAIERGTIFGTEELTEVVRCFLMEGEVAQMRAMVVYMAQVREEMRWGIEQ